VIHSGINRKARSFHLNNKDIKSVESLKSRWLYLNITTGVLISLAELFFTSQES